MIGPLWSYARETLNTGTRITIWDGEVRSAKTVTSLVGFLSHFLANPGPAAILGQSEESMRRNLEPPLREMLGSRLVWKKSEATIAGHAVWIIGAANEGAAARIAGSTLRSLYVDEATTLPETVWNMGLSRLSLPGSRVFATTNPDAPSHWLWQKWLKDAAVVLTTQGRGGTNKGEVARCRMRMEDNPYLPPEYKRAMRSSFAGVWAKRYLEGEWVAGSGRIFDMFELDRHVKKVDWDIKRADQEMALDYGTTHPFAAMFGYVLPAWETKTGRRGSIHVENEWVYDSKIMGESLTDSQYANRLAFWLAANEYRPERVFVPPEAASMYAELRSKGWEGIRDADNRVNDGLRMVANLFATDRLTISPRCERLIDRLPSYSWDEKASEHGKEQPVKENDDECDSLRYLCASTETTWRDIYVPEVAA